jgi:REP-associated tyrosine transposase
MERRYRLRAEGVDLKAVIKRVCGVVGIEGQQLYDRGKEQKRVSTRSLLCYCAVQEIGLSQAHLVRLLDLSPAGVMLSVQRGEEFGHRLGCQLLAPAKGGN